MQTSLRRTPKDFDQLPGIRKMKLNNGRKVRLRKVSDSYPAQDNIAQTHINPPISIIYQSKNPVSGQNFYFPQIDLVPYNSMAMASQVVLVATSAFASLVAARYTPQITAPGSAAMNFLAFYLVACCLSWIFSVLINPHFLSPLRKLPSPPGAHFLMGHSVELFGRPTGLPQLKWLSSISNNGLLHYRGGYNASRIMPTTPAALREVLVTKSYEFPKTRQSQESLIQVLGNGVLVAEGAEHKRQRKALMPAFQYRHIRDLYPVFWDEARKMGDGIAKEIKSNGSGSGSGSEGKVLVSGWATRTTLDIIGRAGCGRSFNSIEDPGNALHRAYERVFAPPPMMSTVVNYLRFLLPLKVFRKLPLRQNRERDEGIQAIREVARDIVRSKASPLKDVDEGPPDILSIARKSGSFSEDELVNQLITFLGAGHETTASSMMWATYLLCRRPDMQKRLREEIRSTLPPVTKHDQEPISDTLFDRMPYLNAICNEVLRLYPPVPAILREAAHDTTISSFPIPKGTWIVVPIWGINNNVAFWGPDAGEFNPERWLADGQANSGGADSNFANTTFLHGPRSCIGQGFAKAEFRCLLAALVGRFEMVAVEGEAELKIVGGLTNKPKGGTWAMMKEIKGW
ncbi:hypothetical protein VTL71DRAFT_10341 [Oculimacula yallundae]|uniref:Cytochrome P450 n=1 Tax=Oculimacula yallundae TaxID=86028 RepID=A0ABR4CT97_9HELO